MINQSSFILKSKKTLIVAALLTLFSSKAIYAHDTCDVDLESGLTINDSKIEFFESEHKDQILYVIDKDNHLFVGGQNITLNAEQHALVAKYSTSIRDIVPQVRNIAIEGVDLAIEGVNLAFNELLGEGNNIGTDLTQELSSIKQEVSERFTIEHGFTLGEDGLEDQELLGEHFEQRIESAVEKAVMGSMGSLLVALGQQIMFSSGDTDAFETRMESFGENIEHEMTLRAEQIERKADSLCSAAVEIDKLEEALKIRITALANTNVITATHVRSHQADDKNLM